ncbi:thiol-disulfide oxidoreductase DCC family protein [Shinella sp.]|uniref:thiol-disulfide oxidoreductase DCC family protein n=1 Tax=Shinella sp. TaxID=1870904 RepID=UPI00403650F0
MNRNDAAGPIIVFDVECILCTANAQFVLKHDHNRHFRLASMQKEVGAALYRRFGIDPANPESMIVVAGDRLFRDSDAVLAIYAGLDWPWKAVSLLRAIPRFLRDPVYRWLARNRYRFFGRREVCWVPSPGDADRML